MTTWPDKPMIRIIKGYDSGRVWESVIALRSEQGNSYRSANSRLIEGNLGDRIEAWEEVTAVPTAALEHLQDVFRGVDMPDARVKALQEVLTHLPADKLSPLDQAVTDAGNIGARDTPEALATDDRIAQLLETVGDVHTEDSRRYRLARVVRLAYTWADLVDPSRNAVADIQEGAAALLEKGYLEDPSIVPMTETTGLIAGRAAFGDLLREALIDLGTYALAWAAQIIASGEELGR